MSNFILERSDEFKEAQRLFGQKEYRQSAQLCRQLTRSLSEVDRVSRACAAILNLLALNAHHLGKFSSASRIFKQAHKFSPNDAGLLSNQAILYKAQGDVKSATSCYEQAIIASPDNMDLYDNLARLYLETQQNQRAIDTLETALRINNNHIPTLLAVGTLTLKLGQEKTAIKVFKKVLDIMPENIQALMHLGLCLQRMELHYESVGYYRKILSLQSNNVQAFTNLGVAYKKIEEYSSAITCYEKAIELAPNIDYLYFNLGGAYSMIHEYQSALDAYEKALKISPHSPNILNGMGFTLQKTGRIDDAIACYQKAIDIEPNHVDAHVNNALANLIAGNLIVGWQEYEWRWKKDELKPLLDKMNYPWWMGESLEGKTLLIMCEQGFGDSILYSRFLKLIPKQSGRITFICRQELFRLFKQLPMIDHLGRRGEIFENIDYFIPLLSLPRLFRTELATLPAEIPYLAAYAADVYRFKHYFAEKENVLKVGICWSGSPTNKSARYRSCELNDFIPLFDLPNIQFYSLQKSIGIGDLPADLPVIDLGNHLLDFADSAAVIVQLDLIITIDTATAHLAGAMGKPVWTLVSFINNWPWIWRRDDTPWYPSMRLYRQVALNDWKQVFIKVREDLAELIHKKHCPQAQGVS